MRFLSGYSIRKQFIFILAVLLVLCFLLGSFAFTSAKRQLEKSASDFVQSTSDQFYSEVTYLQKRIDTVFNTMLMDPNIEQLMVSPFTSRTPAYLNNWILQVSSYTIMNADIVDIALHTPEFSWSSFYPESELVFFSGQLSQAYGTKALGLHHSSLHTAISTDDFLLFGRNVYGMHDSALYGKYLGSIFISIDLSRSNITLPTSHPSLASLLLADENGMAYSFTKHQALEDILPKTAVDEPENTSGKISLTRTEEYLIYSVSVPDSSLSLRCVIDRSAQEREIFQSMFFIILIILTAVAILFLMMLLLSRHMVTPLKHISAYLMSIRDSSPYEDVPPIRLNGCSEITFVCSTLNEMLREQNRLSRKLHETTVTLYESRLEKARAELEFLHSQINPHFLYNTLESIQDIAVENHMPQIASVAGALGKLFRYHIKGKSMVTLEEELDITKAYLKIQKTRFPDKLDILYGISADTRKLSVMKLLLQPLVENAIVHGIEPETKMCTLFLGAKRQDENLILTVYNEGRCIPEEKLQTLRHMLDNVDASPHGGEHIGLLNVQHRIRLQYGPDYGLSIHSAPGQGTRVTVTLPATLPVMPL